MGSPGIGCRIYIGSYYANHDHYGLGRSAVDVANELVGGADLQRCHDGDLHACVFAAMAFPPGDEAFDAMKALRALDNIGDASGALRLTSRIHDDSLLVRAAQRSGKAHQRELDALVKQLGSGNLNPGIGTKQLFNGVFEARARGGARVYFRTSGDTVEILAKSDKGNQTRVIDRLQELYGAG
jgi:putative component of toxin-antitoxin plasmid stabilization module